MAEFYFRYNSSQMSFMDIRRCPYPSILYQFYEISLTFDEIYEKLIAPDLTKEIKIVAIRTLNLFKNADLICIYKNSNAAKIHKIYVSCGLANKKTPTPEFNDFLMKYMEDDGLIRSSEKLFNISYTSDLKDNMDFIYQKKDILDYLNENEKL